MRSFGIVSPQFWTGKTGRMLREHGPDVQVIALYFLTSPHSHMCGLYYIPLQYVAYESGLPMKAIKKAIGILQNERFAYYDEGTEYIWVKEMSHWQVGPIKSGDGRLKSIRNWYDSLPPNPFLGVFFDRYQEELQLLSRREATPEGTPQGAPGGGVTAPKGAIYPSLVPDLVLGLGESEGETETRHDDDPLPKAYGECKQALLTDEQYAKLENKLNSHLPAYIARFDRWKEQNKTNRKYKNRTAYLTIQDWFERDVAEGKVQARASPEQSLEARAAAVRQENEAKGIRYK